MNSSSLQTPTEEKALAAPINGEAPTDPKSSPPCVVSQQKKSSMTTMSKQDQFSSSCGDDGSSKNLLIENSPQKKAKIETKCEETGLIDRISQLPEAPIIKILSSLSIKDAFRTSILSKHWEYFWTCIDNIVYEEEYGHSDSSTVHKFVSLTDKVLPLLSFPSIKRLNLKLAFKYDDSVSYFPKIDKWLEFAVNKKVEDLHLKICYTVNPTENDQPYTLPEVLCSSSSLQKLRCKNCRISEDCVLNWTSLKSLTLETLFLRDEHFKEIMSNSPQLEFLKLYGFCGLSRLNMTSPNCRRLHLTDHDHPKGNWSSVEPDECGFEVVAPYVEHLTISGFFDYTEINLVDLSSLKHAKLDISCDESDEMDKNKAINLLVSVHCADELILSSWFMKVISILMLEDIDVSLPLFECKSLTISSCISKLSFPLLDNLLRSTHYLENLTILPDAPYHPFSDEEDDFDLSEDDIDLLEDDYLSFLEDIFKVSLQKLKNVKVMIFCSRFHESDVTDLDQFLKFLLEHAINLEKLVIVPEHKRCNSCSTNVSTLWKCLSLYPRASNGAIISSGPVIENVFNIERLRS